MPEFQELKYSFPDVWHPGRDICVPLIKVRNQQYLQVIIITREIPSLNGIKERVKSPGSPSIFNLSQLASARQWETLRTYP